MRRSTTTTMTTSLVAILAAGAALALPAQASAPTVELDPQRLTRGADISVPHIEDGDFVDGTRRVELPGTEARIIGSSGDAWLVGTGNVDRNRNRRVVRVAADDTVTDVLRDIDTSTVILSADGSTLAWQRFVSKGRKVITYAASATDGTLIGSKGPGRAFTLLDVSSDHVLLSGSERVMKWRLATDRTRTVVRKHGFNASIEHDLLAVFTRDPYRGGCTKLVRISDPTRKVWRSCRQVPIAFSPDGAQMLTFHILTDGLGPGELQLREADGSKLATYTTHWFRGWRWESPGTLLLEVNGKKKAATVRCTLDACENATDPVRASTP